MKTLILFITLFGSAFVAQKLSAQELAGASVPAKEHEFLQKFVGQWDVESEGKTGDGQPIIGKAVMKSSMLGKLWLVNSSDMEISGMKMKSIQVIGYDPKKEKYVGTWADSMVNHMWQLEGTVDDSGKKMTIGGEGPSMEGDGTMTQYRDVYEFEDNDTIVVTSSVQAKDGKWMLIMQGTAKRRKNK